MPRENAAAAVYGLIVVGALLSGESDRHETYLDTFAATLIAIALYWLAHVYASALGGRLREGERLTGGVLARALVHDLPLLWGATVPLLALLLAWASGAAQETAVNAALWTAAAGLAVFELLAGLRARAAPRELLLDAVVGLAMGGGILALKVLLR